jgi:hypothetical protein
MLRPRWSANVDRRTVVSPGAAGDYLYVPPGGSHGFREGFPALADMTDDERRRFFIDTDNFYL